MSDDEVLDFEHRYDRESREVQGVMATQYEVRSRDRTVSVQRASTAQEALIEYLRSVGCGDDEVVPLSADSVTWRGAVYSAVLIEGTASRGENKIASEGENEIASHSPERAA